jgi:hypothetical protein
MGNSTLSLAASWRAVFEVKETVVMQTSPKCNRRFSPESATSERLQKMCRFESDYMPANDRE